MIIDDGCSMHPLACPHCGSQNIEILSWMKWQDPDGWVPDESEWVGADVRDGFCTKCKKNGLPVLNWQDAELQESQ